MDEHQSLGDEENILQRQRVVGHQNHNHSARARQVVSSAERYPSVPILEAYLVEEEGSPTAADATAPLPIPLVIPGVYDTVYEATPLEPELPWWKQKCIIVFIVIICVLITVTALLAVGPLSRPTAVDNTATTTTNVSTAAATTAPATEDSRLIAYVGNWQQCPTDDPVDAYSHIVLAFASSSTWVAEGQPNICNQQCQVPSLLTCSNQARPDLIQKWRNMGKKVIVSFGGAGMGGSWDGKF
jgi:hypothetical protein